MRIIISILALLIIQLSSLYGQNITVEGRVTDKATGEPVVGVSIVVDGLRRGVVSDGEGNFSITLPAGRTTILASYIGYNTGQYIINSEKNLQDFSIELEGNTNIEEIVVSAKARDINITRVNMGVNRLTAAEIKRMPALLGEVDVIKSIQLLPGVQATSEGSSGFSVRGGAPDQNLILLDNSTVYNASHLMGFFSVFNNDVVSTVDLFKGDIPARYGGRLASLLDVRTIQEMPERFGGSGGIGLISSRLMLESPLGEKTSIMAGARRSYADLFLVFARDKELRNTSMYFYDLNLKASHRISQNDVLELSGYYGNDLYGASEAEFSYGNAAASLTWRHVFNEDLLGRFSAHFSNYNYSLISYMKDFNADWRSGIRDYMLRADFDYHINDLWNLSFGGSSTLRNFNPGIMSARDMTLDLKKHNAFEHAIYASNEQTINDKLTIRYGLRLSVFQNIGKATVYHYDDDYVAVDSTNYPSMRTYNVFTTLEPRIGAVYMLNDRSSIKASYARGAQFIQVANNSASGSPLDVWFAAGPNIKPQTSQMVSLGYFRNFVDNMWEASVEAYYKKLDNVIDFREHADLLLNDKLDGEVRTGKGRAYGIEFMIKKNEGKLTGFINYTLSRSTRTIKEINNGETYPAPYDKPHTVNIVVSYDISKKLKASATWVYASGNPTTYPIGKYEIEGSAYPIFSKRNEYRFPDYHRLDLSLTFIPKPDRKKRFRGEWNLSIYNAYHKKNPWLISFKTDYSYVPYAEMTYLFGIIPSITYNFTF